MPGSGLHLPVFFKLAFTTVHTHHNIGNVVHSFTPFTVASSAWPSVPCVIITMLEDSEQKGREAAAKTGVIDANHRAYIVHCHSWKTQILRYFVWQIEFQIRTHTLLYTSRFFVDYGTLKSFRIILFCVCLKALTNNLFVSYVMVYKCYKFIIWIIYWLFDPKPSALPSSLLVVR